MEDGLWDGAVSEDVATHVEWNMTIDGWKWSQRFLSPDWRLRRLRLAYKYPFELHRNAPIHTAIILSMPSLLLRRGRGRVFLEKCLAHPA